MDWTETVLKIRSDSSPVHDGESGNRVFRSLDGRSYAKLATGPRVKDLQGERDRLAWLAGRDLACPSFRAGRERARRLPGDARRIRRAGDVLSGADLIKAWPSMAEQLAAVHALPVVDCPFGKNLTDIFARAANLVARGAVNPDFLPDRDKPGA